MAEPSIKETKRQMRENMIRARSRLTEKQRDGAARRVASAFIGNVPLDRNDRVACYWPTSGELDIKILMEILTEEGHICALPVVEDDDKPLIFRRWHRGMKLRRHPHFGIFEPDELSPEVIPKVIIVPLVAFDTRGYRLGFGAGLYDRTLAYYDEMTDIFTVGVGFAVQQVSTVPHEAHDQRLDCVITENRTLVVEK